MVIIMPSLCLRDPSNNITPSTILFETAGWMGSICILTAYLHKWEESTDFTLNLSVHVVCLLFASKKRYINRLS